MAERILVVDDEIQITRVLRASLSAQRYDVRTANDPEEALRLFEEWDPDLIVTDVKMPIMDGIALALAAGRDHPDVAIMLMTGFADQRERAHGLDALVHDVIAKPFSVEQIKGAVREALVQRH